MSGRRREYRGYRAVFGILRTDLTETMTIKDQQSILRGGYHKFRFPAVRQQGRCQSYERRRWQVPAREELPGGGTTKIVFQEAARPAYIEVFLKTRCPQEDRRGAN
jgi:hypothetical protein